MLVVIYILGKEFIYLNLIIPIVYGGQKHCIIEYITHNNVLIFGLYKVSTNLLVCLKFNNSSAFCLSK